MSTNKTNTTIMIAAGVAGFLAGALTVIIALWAIAEPIL